MFSILIKREVNKFTSRFRVNLKMFFGLYDLDDIIDLIWNIRENSNIDNTEECNRPQQRCNRFKNGAFLFKKTDC